MSSGFKWGIITLVKTRKMSDAERKIRQLLALNIAKSLASVNSKKPEQTDKSESKVRERVA